MQQHKSTTMFDAETYNENHDLQRRDVKNCLNKYAGDINWVKEGARILDIGSGDGSTTANILTDYIPKNYKVLVGGDINEDMVKFSNQHYAGDRLSFIKLDLEEDVPKAMWESFDHVFSFYAFHWVQKQRTAFTNVHKMLDKGGNCLILVLGRVPFFDMFRIISRDNRWSNYVKNPNKYISPYQDSKNPEIEIKELMESVGFKNVAVNKQHTKYLYKDRKDIINFIKAINPHRIPSDHSEDFLNDCEVTLRSVPSAHHDRETGALEIHYEIMFATGSK